jgi:uncharacterized membrane protein YjjP (DUF1212 family)
MISKPLFKRTFALLFLVAAANLIANGLYLYWTVWWFDIIMHFSAGFCVAMAAVLVWQYFLDKNISLRKSVFVSFLVVLIVGLSWEVFETYFDIAMISDGYSYVTDTISDLILDISGGILGAIYSHRVLNK